MSFKYITSVHPDVINLDRAETVANERIWNIRGTILIRENLLPQCCFAHDKWRYSQIPPLERKISKLCLLRKCKKIYIYCHKWGTKQIAIIFENLVFCNIEVSVLKGITSCVTVPVFQTTQSDIPEDQQCTHGCVNTQNHWHGRFICKRIASITVVQNSTRILDFGFNTSVPKLHEISGRRWKNLDLLGILYGAVEVNL